MRSSATSEDYRNEKFTMIQESQLIEVGYITKLHGLKGEMQATVTDPVFDDVKKCPYLVCLLDGIYVPFFIQNYRFRSDTSMLLTFEDIDTQEKAQPFCGQTLYFDRRCFTKQEAKDYDAAVEEELGYIGYQLIDTELGLIGEITGIDDQTANVLFLVDRNGEELMIPAADDLVEEIDDEARTILMHLPVGLINMDEAEIDE